MNNDTWMTLAGVTAQFLVVLVALFAVFFPSIKKRWNRPKLLVKFNINSRADCHKLPLKDRKTGQTKAHAYFARLQIWNEGRSAANGVEVFAAKITDTTAFLPMNLKWSHVDSKVDQTYQGTIMRTIPKRTYKHCDLLSICSQSKDQMHIATYITPTGDTNFITRGRYHIKLWVSAQNVSPIQQIAHVIYSGQWDDDESIMLGKSGSLVIWVDPPENFYRYWFTKSHEMSRNISKRWTAVYERMVPDVVRRALRRWCPK